MYEKNTYNHWDNSSGNFGIFGSTCSNYHNFINIQKKENSNEKEHNKFV